MAAGESFSAGRLSQPIVLVLLALFVGGGAGAGWLIMNQKQQMARLQADLQQARQQVTKLDDENQELSQQLSSLQEERKTLNDRLSSLRTQLTSVSADLEHSRLGLEELKTRYEQMAEERTKLQTQLAGVTGERDEVRRRADLLEQNNTELERSVNRLRERLTLLDRDYRKLSDQLADLRANPTPILNVIGAAGPTTAPPLSTGEHSGASAAPSSVPQTTVELPPIVVRKDQAGMSVPVRGRILEVNEPQHFVVVDKGSADGVRVGMAFDIVRGANTIGRVTVVRARPQLSACDVVRSKTSGPLQSGDLAVQSGP